MNNLLNQDFANNWWFCSFLYLETVEDDAKKNSAITVSAINYRAFVDSGSVLVKSLCNIAVDADSVLTLKQEKEQKLLL